MNQPPIHLTDKQKQKMWNDQMKAGMDAIESNPTSTLIYWILKTADPHLNQLNLQLKTGMIMGKIGESLNSEGGAA